MITQERVRELFDYDEVTGDLIRRVSRRGRGATVGTVAGNVGRYVRINVDGKGYAAHCLVWLWHHGELPPELDHENRNKLDNRIGNLRVCSRSQNTGNVPLRSTNTSGHRGVWFAKHCGMWRASIKREGKAIHLGYFREIENAAIAYNKAAIDYFGEFATLNVIE